MTSFPYIVGRGYGEGSGQKSNIDSQKTQGGVCLLVCLFLALLKLGKCLVDRALTTPSLPLIQFSVSVRGDPSSVLLS